MAQEIRRELDAAACGDMLVTLERLGTRITLAAPCGCQVARLRATAGSFVTAGGPIPGPAEPVMRESVEVDATRLGFLRQGQEVAAFLAGDAGTDHRHQPRPGKPGPHRPAGQPAQPEELRRAGDDPALQIGRAPGPGQGRPRGGHRGQARPAHAQPTFNAFA
jgi:hypothetical protein